MADPRQILLDMFTAGVDAVKPATLIDRCLALEDNRLGVCGDIFTLQSDQKVHVFGAGKASLGMAKAVSDVLGKRLAGGVIISNVAEQLSGFTVIQGSHPVPDNRSIEAAESLLQAMASLGPDDLYLFLLSGGTSALLEKPLPPLELEEIQKVTKLMLARNIDISAINTVRKHLSAVKGGRLGQSTSASGAILVLSDVVGDDLAVIGSAPLHCDASTYQDAMNVLQDAHIWEKAPASVQKVIKDGCSGKITETPSSPSKKRCHYLVGTNSIALQAAVEKAERDYGIPAKIITSSLQGDAKQAAGFIMAIANEIRSTSNPFPVPVCLLFGGETTVEVHGTGNGGRNQELVLAALPIIKKDTRAALLSCGSDGIDGNSHAAGAIADAAAFERSQHLGLNISEFQQNNDATTFFEKIDSLVITGPTGTNVMDLVFVVLL